MGGTLDPVTLDPVTLDPVTLDPVTLDPLIRSGGLIQSPLGMVIVGARPPIVWANQPARRLGDGLAAAAWPGRAPS